MPDQRLTTTAWANGGDAVAHDDSGRVVFVSGALPGEVVDAVITSAKKRFAKARLVDVLEPSTDRVTPTCPHIERGCGGCDLAHVSASGQRDYAETVVADALGRIGRLELPTVELDAALPDRGYRTTVRCLVEGGRAAYRQSASHSAVVVDSCEIAHPLLAELIAEGRFGAATEVTMRAGVATGERLVIVDPAAEEVSVPADVQVVGVDELAAGRRAWIHEEVADHMWRISARSFFQSRPDGAERLVALVRRALADAPDGPLVDLYSGVGLFAGTVASGRRTQAVEYSPSSVADARHNLAGLDVRIISCSVEKWKSSKAAVVVVDPPRSGLRPSSAAKILETGAERVVLISCDVGSLGRGVGLLAAAGYRHIRSDVVAMFPQTSHVEVVTVLDR